jgi:putative ABC transport system substrate-binding protein
MIDRRQFLGIAAAGTLALATAVGLRAQPAGRVYRVGWIGTLPPDREPAWRRIDDEFRTLGYVEGRNLVLERRFTEGRSERYAELVADLVRLDVDVIVVGSDVGVRAAKATTTRIPIVMYGVTDPVGFGLIASYARPGGNVTGLVDHSFAALHLKRLELLKSVAPKARRVAWLQGDFHGLDSAQAAVRRKEIEAGEAALGVTSPRVQLNVKEDFERAAAEVLRERADALVLSPNPVNHALRREIAEFALKQRLPAVGGGRAHVDAGLLAGFGPVWPVSEIVGYVDRILRGAKPAELPASQSSRFDTALNLHTAAALGLTVPDSVRMRADYVVG